MYSIIKDVIEYNIIDVILYLIKFHQNLQYMYLYNDSCLVNNKIPWAFVISSDYILYYYRYYHQYIPMGAEVITVTVMNTKNYAPTFWSSGYKIHKGIK